MLSAPLQGAARACRLPLQRAHAGRMACGCRFPAAVPLTSLRTASLATGSRWQDCPPGHQQAASPLAHQPLSPCRARSLRLHLGHTVRPGCSRQRAAGRGQSWLRSASAPQVRLHGRPCAALRAWQRLCPAACLEGVCGLLLEAGKQHAARHHHGCCPWAWACTCLQGCAQSPVGQAAQGRKTLRGSAEAGGLPHFFGAHLRCLQHARGCFHSQGWPCGFPADAAAPGLKLRSASAARCGICICAVQRSQAAISHRRCRPLCCAAQRKCRCCSVLPAGTQTLSHTHTRTRARARAHLHAHAPHPHPPRPPTPSAPAVAHRPGAAALPAGALALRQPPAWVRGH